MYVILILFISYKNNRVKQSFLLIFLIGAMLSSCSNNGNKAETGDAQEVEVVKATAATFSTIKDGSYIEWRASHLGGTQKRFGKVFLKNAEISVKDGQVANAAIVIDMSTLTVESFNEGAAEAGDLGGHLKSGDFFNIGTYPTSTFELTSIEAAEGDFSSKVTGNLTILDTTKSITFMANVAVSDSEVSIQSEDFSVNRLDWGLSYHKEGSEGVPVDYLIANDMGFTINVTLAKS